MNLHENFSISKFYQDCQNFKVEKQTYDDSYNEFVKYFAEINVITKHHLIIGINFTYGWMPTIFDFRSDKFDEAIEILNNTKRDLIPSENQLEILKGLFNNSLVGTTKLLHFINPEKLAIWDSRVYRYITGKVPYNHRIGNCKSYLSYLSFLDDLIHNDYYEVYHNSICKKLNSNWSKYRTAELIMYINGNK
ncbi:MAG: hypothetical protein WCH34_07195 [Bacteroidota bacterium]